MKPAPDSDLEKQFAELERSVVEAVELIGRLKRENAALSGELAESERLRQEAARRIDAMLDKIDGVA